LSREIFPTGVYTGRELTEDIHDAPGIVSTFTPGQVSLDNPPAASYISNLIPSGTIP